MFDQPNRLKPLLIATLSLLALCSLMPMIYPKSYNIPIGWMVMGRLALGAGIFFVGRWVLRREQQPVAADQAGFGPVLVGFIIALGVGIAGDFYRFSTGFFMSDLYGWFWRTIHFFASFVMILVHIIALVTIIRRRPLSMWAVRLFAGLYFAYGILWTLARYEYLRYYPVEFPYVVVVGLHGFMFPTLAWTIVEYFRTSHRVRYVFVREKPVREEHGLRF